MPLETLVLGGHVVVGDGEEIGADAEGGGLVVEIRAGEGVGDFCVVGAGGVEGGVAGGLENGEVGADLLGGEREGRVAGGEEGAVGHDVVEDFGGGSVDFV